MRENFFKILILIISFNISNVFSGITEASCFCMKNNKMPIESAYTFHCCKYRLKSEGENSYYYAFFGSDMTNTYVEFCNPIDQPNITGILSSHCTKYDKVFNSYKVYGSRSTYSSVKKACQLIPNRCSNNMVTKYETYP